MITFSEGAKSYFAKIKSIVRKAAPNTWSAGFEILLQRQATWCQRIPESAEGGKDHEDGIYYVLGWLHRSLLISVYTVLTFHPPEQFVQLWYTTKSTGSLSSAGPWASQPVYHGKRQDTDGETSISLLFFEWSAFSLCTFVQTKVYMSWNTSAKHDPNRMHFDKVSISLYIMVTGKCTCRNNPISRSLFHPSQLAYVQYWSTTNTFVMVYAYSFAKHYLRSPSCDCKETIGISFTLWDKKNIPWLTGALFLEFGAPWSFYSPTQKQKIPPILPQCDCLTPLPQEKCTVIFKTKKKSLIIGNISNNNIVFVSQRELQSQGLDSFTLSSPTVLAHVMSVKEELPCTDYP